MSSELLIDDLFGALDGNTNNDDTNNNDEEKEQRNKKPRLNNDDDDTIGTNNKKKDDNDDFGAGVDVDDEVDNDVVAAENDSISNNNNNNNNAKLSKSSTKSTTLAYSELMSSPTAAELLLQQQQQQKGGVEQQGASSRQQQPKNQINQEREREIATGTSHDKSVRSYTSYPKNLPPGHRQQQQQQQQPDQGTNESNESNESQPQPAKQYPFTLDPFQKLAVSCVQNNESVLVAAHTSAGKTAVAEYAIALSLKRGQRVVYTSPIKALSNQKYRDLQEEFGTDNVGLMTGDITINPHATCLVMTTEILRSMLYRGSEIMREVAWVIYDEVHYMRDVERGVVWEESIVLLPHSVRFVFLSATIPNAAQFADWISEVHHQKCHVVYTNYRPVPLQHYIFPQQGDGLHLVVDERGKFRENNFLKAMATLQQQGGDSVDAASADAVLNSGGNRSKKRGRQQGSNNKKKGSNTFTDLHRIVKLIMDRNLHPVIVFSFSKRDCERYALALNREDYCDDDPQEKDLISQVYNNAIDSLSTDDQKLPQVEALLPLLKRGIGIHHGGLLPILKEIVEILFSEGLIKILFATETFSIGINMPAKTVVFTNTRKWDGKDFRWVTSGEYIQMSGRAGRRGKDDRGIVIQMLDEKMEPSVCKDILYGNPDPLNSSYRISYNMLLNLMRVEGVDPEYLLRASFYQYQRERDAPGLLEQADTCQAQADNIQLLLRIKANDNNDDGKEKETGAQESAELLASQYYQMDQQLLLTKRKIAKITRQPEHVLKFLTPGRLVDISIDGDSYGWGVLVSCKKTQHQGIGSGGDAGRLATAAAAVAPEYTIEVLLNCVDRHFDSPDRKGKDEDSENVYRVWKGRSQECRPVRSSETTTNDDDKKIRSMRVFSLVGFDSIDRLSAIKVFVPQDVTLPEARRKVAMSLVEVKKRMKDTIPLLDPVNDLGIRSDEFMTLLKRAEALTGRMASHKLVTEYDDEQERLQLMQQYKKKHELLEKSRALREEARNCQSIAMKDDLKRMKRVLKKLGHVDAGGVIQTKGRTACEVNTANELVVVELMFTGVFNDLSVEQCVALLSCMTFDERGKDDDDPAKGMKSYLAKPFFKLQEVARTVARVESACGIDINEDEFVEKFNPGMMEAVFAWCKGAKFIEVQKLTGSFEGTTIRTLRRLEELVRQIASAAKAIGNQELQAKFDKGGELMKRDIVFCSSLYL